MTNGFRGGDPSKILQSPRHTKCAHQFISILETIDCEGKSYAIGLTAYKSDNNIFIQN